MTDNLDMQAVVVSGASDLVPGQSVLRMRLFNEDGTPWTPEGGSGLPEVSGAGVDSSTPVLYYDANTDAWVYATVAYVVGDLFLVNLPGFADDTILHYSSTNGLEWIAAP